MSKQNKPTGTAVEGAVNQNRIPWPPMILLAALLGGYVLTVFVPLGWVPSPFSDMLAAASGVVLVCAIWIDVATMRTLREARTTIMPHHNSTALVTGGPFRLTRNPIYVANVMIVTAVALMFGALWYLLMAVLTGVLIDRLAIRGEERHLESAFGKRYRDYKKAVRRWL
jgi:protein-S-isoprenylcysteine O-methyltransferase Ste14